MRRRNLEPIPLTTYSSPKKVERKYVTKEGDNALGSFLKKITGTKQATTESERLERQPSFVDQVDLEKQFLEEYNLKFNKPASKSDAVGQAPLAEPKDDFKLELKPNLDQFAQDLQAKSIQQEKPKDSLLTAERPKPEEELRPSSRRKKSEESPSKRTLNKNSARAKQPASKPRKDKISPYDSYKSGTLSYQRYACQGYLKKYGSKPNKLLFWKGESDQVFKRYFMLDHKSQKMRVFHKHAEIFASPEIAKKDDQTFVTIPYSEIMSVFVPPATMPPSSISVQHRWSFEFQVETKQRSFRLLATSDDERELWVFAFNWIINERKRLEKKTEEIAKTTEMFKKLSMEEKHIILKKSLEIKNRKHSDLIKVTDGSDQEIRIDQFLKDEIFKLSKAKDKEGERILKRLESPEPSKEESKKIDLSLDLSKIHQTREEAKSQNSTNHLESQFNSFNTNLDLTPSPPRGEKAHPLASHIPSEKILKPPPGSTWQESDGTKRSSPDPEKLRQALKSFRLKQPDKPSLKINLLSLKNNNVFLSKIKAKKAKAQEPTTGPKVKIRTERPQPSRQEASGAAHVRSQSIIPISPQLNLTFKKDTQEIKIERKKTKRVYVVRKLSHRDGSQSVSRERMPKGFTISKTLERLESQRSFASSPMRSTIRIQTGRNRDSDVLQFSKKNTLSPSQFRSFLGSFRKTEKSRPNLDVAESPMHAEPVTTIPSAQFGKTSPPFATSVQPPPTTFGQQFPAQQQQAPQLGRADSVQVYNITQVFQPNNFNVGPSYGDSAYNSLPRNFSPSGGGPTSIAIPATDPQRQERPNHNAGPSNPKEFSFEQQPVGLPEEKARTLGEKQFRRRV